MKRAGTTGSILVFIAVAAIGAAPVAARAQAMATPVSNDGSAAALANAKSLLEKYKDPMQAVRDGYFSTVGCIAYPAGGGEGTMAYKPGAMGVHFLNVGNIGPALDPAKPQILIYEPVNGKLVLAAAEWFMPADVAGQTRPTIFGKELEGPMAGHAPVMPDGFFHYDLHVWLWKKNPAGTFSPTNADVKCPKGEYTFNEAAPKMGHEH